MDSLGRGGACRGGIIGSWLVILDMADDCAYGGIEWCDGWRVESIMCLTARVLAWIWADDEVARDWGSRVSRRFAAAAAADVCWDQTGKAKTAVSATRGMSVLKTKRWLMPPTAPVDPQSASQRAEEHLDTKRQAGAGPKILILASLVQR